MIDGKPKRLASFPAQNSRRTGNQTHRNQHGSAGFWNLVEGLGNFRNSNEAATHDAKANVFGHVERAPSGNDEKVVANFRKRIAQVIAIQMAVSHQLSS